MTKDQVQKNYMKEQKCIKLYAANYVSHMSYRQC